MSNDDEVNDDNSNDDNDDISDDNISDDDISDDGDYSSDDNSNDDNYDAALLFVYTGVGEGANVPNNVVRVQIDPSLTGIPENAFHHRLELEEVELHDDIIQRESIPQLRRH